MWFPLLSTLLVVIGTALADVSITSPSSGATVRASSGSVTVSLRWSNDDSVPNLDNAASYVFTLCTGPNTDISSVDATETIQASTISGHSYSARFAAASYASGQFYVQIYTTYADGSNTIHYTPRFAVSGLSGSRTPSGSGDPPASVNTVAAPPATAIDSNLFRTPYQSQTGLTKYAPMQMQPGSTVTVTTWSRKFPTSAVTYYTTFRHSLDCLSTMTPGWSYTLPSRINSATPAPFPSVVGWYPASHRLESATLEGNHKIKKRRWDD